MLLAEMLSFDQGITIGILLLGFGWCAKYLFIPWRDNVMKRDVKIAKDNEELIEARLVDMEKQGQERQVMIAYMERTTTALEKLAGLEDVDD